MASRNNTPILMLSTYILNVWLISKALYKNVEYTRHIVFKP